MCEGAPEGVISTLNGFSVWSRMEHEEGVRAAYPWTEPGRMYNTSGDATYTSDGRLSIRATAIFAIGGTGVNHYIGTGDKFEREWNVPQSASYDFMRL